MEKLITNPQEMFDFWKSFSMSNTHILLNWELWAWKTLFVKWFVSWLWLDSQQVQSPTYTILNIYWEKVLHIDMYRIDSYNELFDKWIIDMIDNFDYVIIEWPKFLDFYRDYNWQNISINKDNYTTRTVNF